jgi:histidinol-phosphatase (PHP family)
MRVDIHNHTALCNHATGSMEEYILQAIKKQIDIFGFSCHAPMDFESEYRMNLEQSKEYENKILILKEKYRDKIDIRLGYEVDFMKDAKYMEKDILNANIDYLIGSVHFLDDWGFDNPSFLKNYENKNIDKIWKEYFNMISLMAKTGYFDIVGHLDLIKIFKFLPKNDIKKLALNAMKDIKISNMVIEINGAGFRKPIKEQYPSILLLELAFELNIPITFGSDAHAVEQIGYGYEKAVQIAKAVGYTNCIILKDKKQQIVTF